MQSERTQPSPVLAETQKKKAETEVCAKTVLRAPVRHASVGTGPPSPSGRVKRARLRMSRKYMGIPRMKSAIGRGG